METLALGPRNPTLDKFDKNDILSELDDLIRFCREKELDENIITDINVKTLVYIKKCNKQKTSRNFDIKRT